MADLETFAETPVGALHKMFDEMGIGCVVDDVELATKISATQCGLCGAPRRLGWLNYEMDAKRQRVVKVIPLCTSCYEMDADV